MPPLLTSARSCVGACGDPLVGLRLVLRLRLLGALPRDLPLGAVGFSLRSLLSVWMVVDSAVLGLLYDFKGMIFDVGHVLGLASSCCARVLVRGGWFVSRSWAGNTFRQDNA